MPSKYVKKTDRPRQYPKRTIASAVKLANETTISHASRITGLSTFTIRRHLIAAGFTPKPRGNPTVLDDHGQRLAATTSRIAHKVLKKERNHRLSVGYRNR